MKLRCEGRGLVIGAVMTGCAVRRPMAFRSAIAAGDRAYTAGRMADARVAFDRAALATTYAHDRDEAVYLAADAARRAGDLEGALTRYDGLADAHPPGERAARSALEAARMRRTAHPMADSGLLAVVRRFPRTGPARRALELLLEDTDAADPTMRRSVAMLDELAADASLADMLDAVLLHRARRLERAGDTAAALAGYERLLNAVPYPHNARWDDGGLAYVRLLRTSGNPRRAIAVADRVLAVREISYNNGDYEAPCFGELAMLRAEILRDDLHDASAAVRSYHFVYSSFRSSLLRDDALWQEAVTRTAMGDAPGACDVYFSLAREFPCTHWGREALAHVTQCGRSRPERSPHACD